GVERRRLAAAGGAGDEDQPVRAADQPGDRGPLIGLEPEGLEVQSHHLAALQADVYAFAVHAREDADAKVVILAADRHLAAAVLGQPPLGDVQVAHDLDAR